MTIKAIKERYLQKGKYMFTVFTNEFHGKVVVVVKDLGTYRRKRYEEVVQIVRVSDGAELLNGRSRPCDNLEDAADVANEMLYDEVSSQVKAQDAEGEKTMALNAKETQVMKNAEQLIGEYYNGILDDPDCFKLFQNVEAMVDWIYPQIFDMKSDGNGYTRYRDGICDNLKFLGEKRIRELIASVEGWEDIVCEEQETEIEVGELKTAVIQMFEVKHESGTFVVEIHLDGNEFDVYLQKVGKGVKDMMFGLPVGQCGINSFDDVKRLTIENLKNESYIEDYNEDYGL